jgi:hypothetical protein
MGLTYFKRFRMEMDLRGCDFSVRSPTNYRLLAWDASFLDAHAEAKYLSFRGEIDANVFPCLGSSDGCRRLMSEISRRRGFLGVATWLAAYVPGGADGQQRPPYGSEQPIEYCGTVQGIRDNAGFGAIQNLGVTPAHRGSGLGTMLMYRALEGFRRAGLSQACLEVTSQNDGAVRLYERMGFSRIRTVYKAVEIAYS